MKMDFHTGGAWHQVRQSILVMKIYDFSYSSKSLTKLCLFTGGKEKVKVENF